MRELLRALTCVLWVGCGTSHTPSGPADATINDTSPPDGVVGNNEPECTAPECFDRLLEVTCRRAIEGKLTLVFDPFVEPCAEAGRPTARRLREAILSGRLAFNLRKAIECLDNNTWLRECAGAFEGRVVEGDLCDDHLQCVSGFCEMESAAGRSRPHYVQGGCGRCRQSLEGGACDAGFVPDTCTQDFTCRSNSCKRLAGEGESCAETSCRIPFRCRQDLCVFPERMGEDCTTTLDCERMARCLSWCPETGRACEDGPCQGGCRSTCEPAEREVGEVCERAVDCAGACIDGVCATLERGERCKIGECRDGLVCAVGECKPVLPVGSTCGPEQVCQAGVCDGVCIALQGLGESCDPTVRCVRGTDCLGGICRVAPGLGETCDRHCRNGVCREGVCRTPPSGTQCGFRPWSACGELACSGTTCKPVAASRPVESSGPCPTDNFRDEVSDACLPFCFADPT